MWEVATQGIHVLRPRRRKIAWENDPPTRMALGSAQARPGGGQGSTRERGWNEPRTTHRFHTIAHTSQDRARVPEAQGSKCCLFYGPAPTPYYSFCTWKVPQGRVRLECPFAWVPWALTVLSLGGSCEPLPFPIETARHAQHPLILTE